jgi:hypothetical protein
MFLQLLTSSHLFAITCNKPTFLGLESWYAYLPYGADSNINTCTIQLKGTGLLGAHSPFLLVGLAIIDDLIRIAALVAVGYVIYGGIQYITSGGSPNETKQAQDTIINALIGLVLAILAASIVAFIGNRLGG